MTELLTTSLCKLSVNVFYDAKARNSFCWKYFGHLITFEGNKKKIVNSDKVYCSACLSAVKKESEDITFGSVKIKSYNVTVSTGNLTRHLRDNHQIKDESTCDKSRRKFKDICDTERPTDSSSSTSSTKLTPRRDKWLLARDLALWFCKSLLPFDSVADEGMVDFFKKYNIVKNGDDVPSRHTVSGSALSDVFESVLMNVKGTIAVDGAQQFALALDSWTDHYRRLNYITFTLHYLTADYHLKALTLSTKIITGERTREKIIEAIEDVKKSFLLDGKSIIAVTNAGNNEKQAVEIANMDHHLCLGHALHNLITVDGINSVPEIKMVVQKCKGIVKALRYHGPELQIIAKKEQLEFLNKIDIIIETLESDESDPMPEVDLSLDENNQEDFFPSGSEHRLMPAKTATPSRWHCVLELLESVLHICKREAINKMLGNIGQEELKISLHEMKIVDDLVKFLRRFREAVEILTSQKTCTLNVAVVFRSEIIDVLNSFCDDESQIMLRLKHNMSANLHNRFPVTKAIVAAALLDNRFMSLKEIDLFLEQQNMKRTSFLTSYIKEKEIINYNELQDPLAVNTSSKITSSNKTDSLLLKLSKKHSINPSQGLKDDPIEQECWRYIAAADPSEPKDGDLLSFWNNRKEVFPYLAALAKCLLCVPATSAPSERIFSGAGLNITAKRSRLSPICVDKIIFTHDNYKMCNTDDKH